jgi:hypothetical protein
MKNILFIALFVSGPALAGIVGISTHPMNREGKALSAEMTGYMSNRNEMGAGLRYTQSLNRHKILDVTAAGGQDSRGLTIGTGVDVELLSEDIYQPRVSIKSYFQHQKYESNKANLVGVAPTIRKGFSLNGQEFFPYLAMPSGLKIDSMTEEFVYYSSMTVGASMPIPGANENILLSVEGNKNMGASSDYFGCLVSWVWN